jgi:hypothetical protein
VSRSIVFDVTVASSHFQSLKAKAETKCSHSGWVSELTNVCAWLTYSLNFGALRRGFDASDFLLEVEERVVAIRRDLAEPIGPADDHERVNRVARESVALVVYYRTDGTID